MGGDVGGYGQVRQAAKPPGPLYQEPNAERFLLEDQRTVRLLSSASRCPEKGSVVDCFLLLFLFTLRNMSTRYNVCCSGMGLNEGKPAVKDIKRTMGGTKVWNEY